MAEHTLEARILLRYDTFIHWINSDIILKLGEAAIVAFPNRQTINNTDDTPINTPPAIGIKIGDGVHDFESLPWVQGIAADVYLWAKASTPPAASTIPGLEDFIDNYLSGGSGSGSDNGGILYRIIYDSNTQKYILLQYDTENELWVNTTSEISLADIFNRINTIERWANGARTNLGNIEGPLVDYVYEEVINYMNRMDYNDLAIAHQFVTSVVQENGKISVTRAAITASDISGTIPTAHGGTGLTYIEEDEVLVGDINGNIKTMRFVTNIDEERMVFATAGAIKDYVDAQTAGITGAMHFIGETGLEITINPPSRINPNIPGYNFTKAQPGDVILGNGTLEFVWTGNFWRLLGDEGSYAIKGSIKNVDIADDAAIAQSKIDGLVETLENKVNVEVGKGLSTNDYTNEEKNKLAGIEDNALRNIIEHILLNDVEAVPHTVGGVAKTVELMVKEFDDASRTKLATIEEGAQVNAIESIALNGTVQSPDNNKQINLIVSEFSADDKAKLDSIETGAQVNVIEHIYLNDTEVQSDPLTKRIDLNIVTITLEQIDKLNSIEEGAQVNVIESIVYDNVALVPDNHGVVVIEPDPHTEHENVIESIVINGTEYPPDLNKQVNITLDQAALDLNVLEGAEIPGTGSGSAMLEVEIILKKLLLARIAATGDVSDLLLQANTYIILDCGNSTEIID